MVGQAHGAGDWVFGILILAAVLWFLWWLTFTDNGRVFAARRRASKQARAPKTISQAGVQSPAGLACPKCGGTQFKVRRKTSTKVMFGAASLLGQAKWVRCVTCGTAYRRG